MKAEKSEKARGSYFEAERELENQYKAMAEANKPKTEAKPSAAKDAHAPPPPPQGGIDSEMYRKFDADAFVDEAGYYSVAIHGGPRVFGGEACVLWAGAAAEVGDEFEC